MIRRVTLGVFATLIFTCAAVFSAAVASAHAALIASDPADGAQLTIAPQRVNATFNEPMRAEFAAMTVIGPDHNAWSSGATTADGAVLSVALRPLGPAGTYTVNYRATSVDGHVVTGSWSFTLTVAGAGTPDTPVVTPSSAPGAADTGDPARLRVWQLGLGALVVVTAGLLWWFIRRRT